MPLRAAPEAVPRTQCPSPQRARRRQCVRASVPLAERIVDLHTYTPSWTLQAYISSYLGYTKYRRLLFIAQRAAGTQLELDALRMAIDELKRTENTVLYRQATTAAQGRLGPGYDCDDSWAEQVDRQQRQRIEKVESDLNAAKNNMIKESIRMDYNDMGDLLLARGDLQEAFKSYLRSRDYCTQASSRRKIGSVGRSRPLWRADPDSRPLAAQARGVHVSQRDPGLDRDGKLWARAELCQQGRVLRRRGKTGLPGVALQVRMGLTRLSVCRRRRRRCQPLAPRRWQAGPRSRTLRSVARSRRPPP